MRLRLRKSIFLWKKNNNMSPFFVVATSEVKTLFRERILFLLLGVFIFMTLAASFIGWLTFSTTTAVYHTSVIYLHQHGIMHVPGNPILSFSSLASFRNMIVYMFLIGSLMAIVVGNRSFIRERKSGTLQLLFTRPTSLISFLSGKVMGIGFILLGIVVMTAIISIGSSYLLPLPHLNTSEIFRLLVFYGYSFFYIFFFALIGLLFAITARSESLALFIPVCIWVGISFVMPEFVTGQTPIALLNPVTITTTVSQGSFFSRMQQVLTPISLGWHYTLLGGQLLNATADTHTVLDILFAYKSNIVVLAISLIGSFFLCFLALQKFDVLHDVVNE